MGENRANKILMNDDEEEDSTKNQNTFSDGLNELGKALFFKYPKKTSNLSSENENGIIQAESLNEYMDRNWNYRYASLDVLIAGKRDWSVSRGGLGIEKLIEIVKSIQATFEQTQIPTGLRSLFNR